MEPQDLVKLLYQSEFGGGHLIEDPQDCLRRLTEEYGKVSPHEARPLTEEIGGSLLRVDLHALDTRKIPLTALNDIFVRSAAQIRGTIEHFTVKLNLLLEMARAGELGVTENALGSYLQTYFEAGFPAVSHSEAYKKAYGPAYRVVCRDLFIQLL